MTAMNRALIALCVLASVVEAAPKYTRPAITSTDPALVAAEKAWTAAAAETDRAKVVAAWEAAAAAFVRVVDAGVVTKAEQKDAAYAAVLAWKNALNVDPRIAAPAKDTDYDKVPTPQPLDARDQGLIHALDAYLTFSPTPDEAAEVKFLRANLLRRRDHLDKAMAGFLDILAYHRDHEVAEYAANLLLDSYNRLQRYDDMTALVAKLRVDKAFLANKPDLAETVNRIHLVAMRRGGEGLERKARTTRDRVFYDQCGEAYLAVLAEPNVPANEVRELLYNAGVCFQEAGSIDRALATHQKLIKDHPTSSLAGRAMARVGKFAGQVGRYREAVDAIEQYVQRYPGEKDAADAASDGVLYAVVTGDLVRAARIADLAIARFGTKQPRIVIEATLVVLEAQLAAGKRKEALARARSAANKGSLQRMGDPVTALRAGRAFASAACPVEPTGDRGPIARARPRAIADELCPKSRDRALVAAARVQLALAGNRAVAHHGSSAGTAPLADHATRLELDLDLELVLATRTPAASAFEPVVRGYEKLIADTRSNDVKIAAHARLGTLHRHLGDRDKAVLALRGCVTEARATFAGSEWLARCERDLIALGEPDLDILPERLARATATPAIVVEQLP
jgi:tetratricopeptide (TPR) repeat protein